MHRLITFSNLALQIILGGRVCHPGPPGLEPPRRNGPPVPFWGPRSSRICAPPQTDPVGGAPCPRPRPPGPVTLPHLRKGTPQGPGPWSWGRRRPLAAWLWPHGLAHLREYGRPEPMSRGWVGVPCAAQARVWPLGAIWGDVCGCHPTPPPVPGPRAVLLWAVVGDLSHPIVPSAIFLLPGGIHCPDGS